MKDLYTAVQAANFLGVSRQQVYYLAARGRLGTKLGNFWLFTQQELDDYVRTYKGKRGRPRKNRSDT